MVLPKYRQHVTCPTRDNNILDHCYTTMLDHLKDITGPSLDPLQFAYRANRSVDDAVNMGLHYVLQHLDRPGAYVRILFVDFSSAFNTIIPNLLLPKLTQLSVLTSICQWINSFLTDRQQLVRLGKYTSSTRTISTGVPQGCVLSPLLFSRYTNDCIFKDPSAKVLNIADDTIQIGLIQDGDESAYSGDDLQDNPPCSPLLTIMNSTVIQFYSAIIESVIYTSITVWFSTATKSDLRRLWRVVRTAERIIGSTLPTLQDLYLSRVNKRAGKSLWTPHIQHTPSLNSYRLVDATEL